MDLRNKLLFYFVTLIVISLLIFVLSSYQIARESTIKIDTVLLRAMAVFDVREIIDNYRHGRSIDQIVDELAVNSDEHGLRLLLTRQQYISYSAAACWFAAKQRNAAVALLQQVLLMQSVGQHATAYH